jgi:hypothetical protein
MRLGRGGKDGFSFIDPWVFGSRFHARVGPLGEYLFKKEDRMKIGVRSKIFLASIETDYAMKRLN